MQKTTTIFLFILICLCQGIGQVDNRSAEKAFRELDSLVAQWDRRVKLNDSLLMAFGMGEIQHSLPNATNVAEMDAIIDGLSNLLMVPNNIEFEHSGLRLTKSDMRNVFKNGLECGLYLMYSVVLEEGKPQKDFYERVLNLKLPKQLGGANSFVAFLQASNSKYYEYKTYKPEQCSNEVMKEFKSILRDNGITVEEKIIDQSQNSVSVKLHASTNAFEVTR